MFKYKVILIATLLLCFSFTNKVLAQNQKLTLNFSKAPVSQVVKEIKTQTGLSVIYNSGDLNPNTEISIASKDEPIAGVIQKILSQTPGNLAYEIKDNYIVISKGGKDTDAILQANKKRTITGTVVDNNNEPLIGVNVIVDGTSNGTATDSEGNFALSISENERFLLISYIGYESQRLNIAGKNTLRVVMREDGELLDELVVTALGIKRSEKALSYNVQEIKADEITKVKDANFVNSLAGKVAGVNINTSSSGVGGATRVVMRGTKSISANNNALYVIDGVPILNTNNGTTEGTYSTQPKGEGISDINPEDIESMTVLSGPAAAALYGSNAAQGVILITTKKGQEGKLRVTVSNSSTFSKPFIMPKFQNRYANRVGEFKSWSDSPSTYDYEPKNFFNTGTNIQNTITLSMGNEKNQSYLSVGTTNADGMIVDNSYNRYNFTFRNTTSFFEDKMKLDVGMNYIIQNDKNMMAQGEYYNPLIATYLFPRGENFDAVRLFEEFDEGRQINVQRWDWGTQGLSMQNPYWIAKRNTYGTKKSRYMMNAGLTYDITDWLNIGGRVRVDNANSDYERKNYASTAELFAGHKGFYSFEKSNDKQVYSDVIANLDKRFNDFSLSANLGASITHMS